MQKYSLPDNLPPSERVTLDELRPYLALHGRDPFEAHLHSFNQIVWFRAGAGVHLVDFVEHAYGQQTLVYVPHGAVHAFRKDDALDGAILHFDDVMAMGSSDGQSLPGILRSLALSSGHSRTLSSAQALLLESSIEMLASELSAQDTFGKSTAIEAALRLLLVRVCRQFQETTEPRSTEYKRYLEFLGLVECHYSEGLSIEAYPLEARPIITNGSPPTSPEGRWGHTNLLAEEPCQVGSVVHTHASGDLLHAQIGMNEQPFHFEG